MMRILNYLLILILVASCKQTQMPAADPSDKAQIQLNVVKRAEINTNKSIQKIAFGSCNKSDQPQLFWPYLTKENIDLWIWLGDNIYGDTENMQVMAKKYNRQLAHQSYQDFIGKTPVLGIWDDHDFGVNNGGKEYPKRAASQALMLDFLGIPKSNPVWKRQGAYYSYVFEQANNRLKIIFLDSRYHRDQPNIQNRKYVTEGFTGDMLGEEQWKWFEKEIEEEADVYIIANGTQFLAEDHRFEKWANFPLSRNRLLTNLEKIRADKIVLLSGDRHIGEFAEINLQNGAKVLEATASGMTHSYEDAGDEPNRYRVGHLVNQKHVGILNIDWTAGPDISLQLISADGNVFETVAF